MCAGDQSKALHYITLTHKDSASKDAGLAAVRLIEFVVDAVGETRFTLLNACSIRDKAIALRAIASTRGNIGAAVIGWQHHTIQYVHAGVTEQTKIR